MFCRTTDACRVLELDGWPIPFAVVSCFLFSPACLQVRQRLNIGNRIANVVHSAYDNARSFAEEVRANWQGDFVVRGCLKWGSFETT